MELLRKLFGFGAPQKDIKLVYISCIRSVCDQSSSAWHSGLTQQNSEDSGRFKENSIKDHFERKVIVLSKFSEVLGLKQLKDKREYLAESLVKTN